MSPVRVRFAPSPSATLHLGAARTAVFNALYAARHGGTMVLRIEDSEQEPAGDENTHEILEGLAWLGIEWSEGPWIQSLAFDRHRGEALRLLSEGRAYRCFCPPELLERKRQLAGDQNGGFKYDRTCRALSAREGIERAVSGFPFCVRLLVPHGHSHVTDLVRGAYTFNHEDVEDFVLLRADGTPSYQLSAVCDDFRMGVTHVIRNDDYFPNTARQTLLHRALGNEPPVFAHLPIVLGPDGRRFNRKHGPTSLLAYREMGIPPLVMVNFLARMGWRPDAAPGAAPGAATGATASAETAAAAGARWAAGAAPGSPVGRDARVLPFDAMAEQFAIEDVDPALSVYDRALLDALTAKGR